MTAAPIELVLFDLDGTLADTAPDLAAAANRLRADRGLQPLPLEVLRPLASHGARGLIGRALDLAPGEPDYEAARATFLAYYEQAICVGTTLFAGMAATLDRLEADGRRWGVVTNKASRFTVPLMAHLGLHDRAACVVSGDTTPHTKPHPEPLLQALRLCRVGASSGVYVGDDRRDVEAGRAAGMRTVIAAYGYLGENPRTEDWGADHSIDEPTELLAWLPRP
jgi:2-phosphoglycolate phosphatase